MPNRSQPFLRSALLASSAVLWLHPSAALAQATAPSANPMQAQGEQWRIRWKQADLDNDGQLSKAEASAAGMKRLSERFGDIDANRDGKLSDAELSAWMKSRRRGGSAAGDKPHAQDKAHGTQANPGPGKEGGMGYKTPEQRQAAMAQRFAASDTNKDGGLSKAELSAAGSQRMLEHFDAIDSNKDGKINPDEIRSAWERRKQ